MSDSNASQHSSLPSDGLTSADAELAQLRTLLIGADWERLLEIQPLAQCASHLRPRVGRVEPVELQGRLPGTGDPP